MVLQRFPTEKYKQLSTRSWPLLTLSMLLMLASLNFLNYVSLITALSYAGLVMPFIVWAPISAMMTSINNVTHERKMTKAVVMIAAISLAAVVGGLLGYFGLSQSLFFIPIVIDFLNACIFSPFIFSLCTLTGSLLAHATNRNPRDGAYQGAQVGLLAPITVLFIHLRIPFIFDVVCMCGLGLAFITSIVAKQSLRAYYKYQYGHSNADGYQMDKTENAQNTFIAEQAQKFNVSELAFKNLINYCKHKIGAIKKQASFYQVPDHESPDQEQSNSFKDIYHGLMNPKSRIEDRVSVKELLRDTIHIHYLIKPDPILELKLKSATYRTIHSDLFLRTLFHQHQIDTTFEKAYIEPFMSV